MLDDQAILDAEQVGYRVCRCGGLRQESCVQEDQVALGNGSDDLPTGVWKLSHQRFEECSGGLASSLLDEDKIAVGRGRHRPQGRRRDWPGIVWMESQVFVASAHKDLPCDDSLGKETDGKG